MDSLIYNRSFRKKTGEVRNMRFLRLNELTADTRKQYGVPEPTGNAAPKYDEGSEIVWDLDAKGYRVFNWRNEVK